MRSNRSDLGQHLQKERQVKCRESQNIFEDWVPKWVVHEGIELLKSIEDSIARADLRLSNTTMLIYESQDHLFLSLELLPVRI